MVKVLNINGALETSYRRNTSRRFMTLVRIDVVKVESTYTTKPIEVSK